MNRRDWLRRVAALPVASIVPVACPHRALPFDYDGWIRPGYAPCVPEVEVLDPLTGESISHAITGVHIRRGLVERLVMEGDHWTEASLVEERPFIFVDGAGQRWDSRDYEPRSASR